MGARNEANWLLIQARAEEIAARARREYIERALGGEAALSDSSAPPASVSTPIARPPRVTGKGSRPQKVRPPDPSELPSEENVRRIEDARIEQLARQKGMVVNR